MTAPPSHVIIVGAGLGGSALAIALHERSIPATIYELRPVAGDIGGAVALAPNALRVMDALGVYKTISTQGHKYENLRFVNESGGKIGDFANGSVQLYGYPALRIKRSLLLKALHDEVSRLGIEIRFGMKCVKVEDGAEGSTAFFEDGTSATAPLVVGFDGIHSRVRQFVVGEEIEPEFTTFVGIGGTAPLSAINFPSKNYQMPAMIVGQKGHFALMPRDPAGEEVGCFSTCVFSEEKTREEWIKFEKEEAMTYLRDKLRDWPEPVASLLKALDVSQAHVWPVYSLPLLKRWHTAHIVLCGDAVHAMSPTGGQGSAQAFEDGALLARYLSSLSESLPLSSALDKWETARRKRVDAVVEFANKSGNSRKEAPSYFEEKLKEWAMWLYFSWAGGPGASSLLNSYDVEKVDLNNP